MASFILTIVLVTWAMTKLIATLSRWEREEDARQQAERRAKWAAEAAQRDAKWQQERAARIAAIEAREEIDRLESLAAFERRIERDREFEAGRRAARRGQRVQRNSNGN